MENLLNDYKEFRKSDFGQFTPTIAISFMLYQIVKKLDELLDGMKYFKKAIEEEDKL